MRDTKTIITYAVDLLERDGAYFVRLNVAGRAVPEFGPIRSEGIARELQTLLASSTRTTIEAFVASRGGSITFAREVAAEAKP